MKPDKTPRGVLIAVLYGVLLASLFPLSAQTVNVDYELEVIPGKRWNSTMWIGPVPMKKAPQIAAWIETESGEFIATLTVSSRASRESWIGSPKDGRPEALPVWSHARGGAQATDAETSATPKAGLAISGSTVSLIPGHRYRVRIEVNHSFDYNQSWPKRAREGEANYSGVNGQPSLVYEALITAGSPGKTEFTPTGTGSIDGSDGVIRSGTQGITTALSIIERAEIRLK